MDGNGGRPLLLARPLPAPFRLRLVTLPAGRAGRYDPAEWRDALVVVARGAVELRLLDGRRRRFERGSVLCLDGLPLRALVNPGRSPAVLVAVSRAPGPLPDRRP
jgi:hypothetical protein